MLRVGLNGAGRIGRTLLRQIAAEPGLSVVAVNDVASAETIAHLYAYDSVYGRSGETVSAEEHALILGGRRMVYSREREPERIPWAAQGVAVVVEATGRLSPAAARGHSAAHVIMTRVCDADATVVLGVREDLPAAAKVLSAASCTTHAAALPLSWLDARFGVEAAQVTTVHCTTGSQSTMDQPHADLRRSRSALVSMIPTTTSAARGLEQVLPQLRGKLSCLAVRVPTASVSMVEIVAQTRQPLPTVEALRSQLVEASQGPLTGYLAVSDAPLVSVDFRGDPHSCVIDAPLLEIPGTHLVRLIGWYDNEWGYTARLVDLLRRLGQGH